MVTSTLLRPSMTRGFVGQGGCFDELSTGRTNMSWRQSPSILSLSKDGDLERIRTSDLRLSSFVPPAAGLRRINSGRHILYFSYKVVTSRGFEPLIFGSGGRRSIQLSYEALLRSLFHSELRRAGRAELLQLPALRSANEVLRSFEQQSAGGRRECKVGSYEATTPEQYRGNFKIQSSKSKEF